MAPRHLKSLWKSMRKLAPCRHTMPKDLGEKVALEWSARVGRLRPYKCEMPYAFAAKYRSGTMRDYCPFFSNLLFHFTRAILGISQFVDCPRISLQIDIFLPSNKNWVRGLEPIYCQQNSSQNISGIDKKTGLKSNVFGLSFRFFIWVNNNAFRTHRPESAV